MSTYTVIRWKKAMTEAELRAKVVETAHQLGWMVYSTAQARISRPVRDASGYPDLTLARDRRVLFIELKQEDGVLRPEQMRWMRELLGMYVIRPSDLGNGVIDRLLA